MRSQISDLALERFTSFGDLLKYLRRRSGLTQRELSIAVGYSHAQISRLELNQRQPELATAEVNLALLLRRRLLPPNFHSTSCLLRVKRLRGCIWIPS